MNDYELNRHHLIPKSKGGASNELNCVKIDVKEHNKWHLWCGNDTPIEAICRVLLMNEKIFTDNFKQDLINILDIYMNNYYEKKTHSGFIKSEVERVLDTEEVLFNTK